MIFRYYCVIAFLHLKANKHMTRWIVAQQAPLQVNANGVFLVGTTSVALDAVVAVFNQDAIAFSRTSVTARGTIAPC